MNETIMRIAFLFNHDAAHQAAHIAAIAGDLATQRPDMQVFVLCGTADIASHVNALIKPDQARRIVWIMLDLPPWMQLLSAPFNKIAPVRRVARLYRNLDLFGTMDAIVSTERTCLRIKRSLLNRGRQAPQFIYVPHGSGDRNVAYHPELKQFDFMLLSGQKLIDEMVDWGARPRFFKNDRPVFVYNPHFDPLLSSWYDHGPELMDWFASPEGQGFNLIFAPHVMLFRKTLHISPEYKIARLRPKIKPEWLAASNILIDTDGPRLFDMSYTRAADAYIGDVSSQVYEFLFEPRAVYFIDTHIGEGQRYDFWSNGLVVDSVPMLTKELQGFEKIAAQYLPVQLNKMAYTIDRSDPRPASVRGANAIAEIMSL
jgi:hypothetical protein